MEMQAIVNAPRRAQQPQFQSYGWYVLALGISLAFHAGFLVWSKKLPMNGLKESTTPMLLPPRFVVKQVTVDPKNLEQAPEPAKTPEKVTPKVDTFVFSETKPQSFEMKMEAKPVDAAKQLVEDKPRVAPTPVPVEPVSPSKLGMLDAELSSLAGGFLKSAPVSKAQPVLSMGKGDPNGSKTGADNAIPGRQSIDAVLEGLGKVPMRENPVAIPGNALFAYDSVDLGPGSLPTLEKIAELRRSFPDYIMVIIGHTDSLGTADYNQRLSYRRAEAVKDWLVKRYGMNPAKLETSGKGATELLVSADKSVEEQSANRRVEVLLRPASTPRAKPSVREP